MTPCRSDHRPAGACLVLSSSLFFPISCLAYFIPALCLVLRFPVCLYIDSSWFVLYLVFFVLLVVYGCFSFSSTWLESQSQADPSPPNFPELPSLPHSTKDLKLLLTWTLRSQSGSSDDPRRWFSLHPSSRMEPPWKSHTTHPNLLDLTLPGGVPCRTRHPERPVTPSAASPTPRVDSSFPRSWKGSLSSSSRLRMSQTPWCHDRFMYTRAEGIRCRYGKMII